MASWRLCCWGQPPSAMTLRLAFAAGEMALVRSASHRGVRSGAPPQFLPEG